MSVFIISLIVKISFLLYLVISFIWLWKFKLFSKKKRIFYFILFHILIFMTVSIITYINIKESLLSIRNNTFYQIKNITTIKVNDKIIGKIGNENREYEKLENIPSLLLQTIINVEDEYFFTHYGINLKKIIFNFLKAAFTNKKVAGASTITQQLSKNLFLSNKPSVIRKIKEIFISIYLSYYASKNEILEMYVNYIYLGNNCYGIKSASKNFFDKNLNELNINEIAFLTAVIKGPSYYIKNLTAGMERKNYVLYRMWKTNLITEEEYIFYKDQDIKLTNKNYNFVEADYLYIVEEIKDFFKSKNLKPEDGYTVYINIDDNLQKSSTNILKSTLEEIENKILWKGPIGNKNNNIKDFIHLQVDNYKVVFLYKDGTIENGKFKEKISTEDFLKYSKSINEIDEKVIVLIKQKNNEWFLANPIQLNGGVIIINIHTGEILTTVGGIGTKYSFFNSINKVKKSPGSIAKIFALLAAMEKGLSPSTELLDDPIYIDGNGNIFFLNENEVPAYLNRKDIKVVRNHDRKYLGQITLENSIVFSRNIPIILLAKKIGINFIKSICVKMGILDNNTSFFLSGVLGSIYVTVESMARGLSSIGNGGYKIKNLYLINKITNFEGEVIYENTKEELMNNREKIFEDSIIKNSQKVLNSVANRGVKNQLSGFANTKLCCKTGTAQDNKEASFVVWDKNYLIYTIVYNTDHNNPAFVLWGSNLPLFITKQILKLLQLESGLYLE
jgi:penicillin-binding protein 1A